MMLAGSCAAHALQGRWPQQGGEQAIEHIMTPRVDAHACFQLAQAAFNCPDPTEARTLLQQALARYDEAVAAEPGNPILQYNRGLVLQHLERYEEALACYDLALAVRPRHADTMNNKGTVLLRLKRHAEALACFEAIFQLVPDHADAYSNATMALLALNRPMDALASARRAVALRPRHADAHNQEGLALMALQRPQEALACYDRGLALQPDQARVWLNRANAQLELGQLTQALVDVDRAISLNPQDPQAPWHKGLCLLKSGVYPAGWALYEWRWKRDDFTSPRRGFAAPQWLGEPMRPGQTLLLHHEQGLGDTVQMLRYLPWLTAQGVRVVAEMPRPLMRLVAGMPGVDDCVPWGEPLPAFDWHCPVMSLPHALRDVVQGIPPPLQPLPLPEGLRDHWAARLPPRGQLRVGLAWSGSTAHRNDRLRSMVLADLLAHLPDGIEYHVLQNEVRPSDEDALRQRGLIDHRGELKDLADAAGLCAQMDLVLAVDTSLAHLAGSLGVPTWLLLPRVSDWRWMQDRRDSPWYPSMTLYRQGPSCSWAEVLQTLAQDLARLAGVTPPDPHRQALVHYREANQCYAHERMADALAAYDRAVALAPHEARFFNNRGNALLALERPQAALDSYDQALKLAPDFLDPLTNRGLALQALGRDAEVLMALERVAERTPNDPEAHLHLGLVRMDQHQLKPAIQSFERALALAPGHTEAHWNLSIACMLDGQLRRGWVEAEWRKHQADHIRTQRRWPTPEWLGQTDLRGKTLLLHHEQGLGDSLQMVRYVPLLQAMGAQVLMDMPMPLVPLLQQLPGVQWLGDGQGPPPHDLHCPMMSLPYALREQLPDTPNPAPYLRCHPSLRAQWQARLGPATGPRVGLAWSGSVAHRNDRKRSMALADWAGRWLPGIEYHVLQKDLREADRATLAASPLRVHSDELHDFNHTAALCAAMDLVITVDTSVVHLAGALGRPTWLLLPYSPDWRWRQAGERTPWYGSVRIFRQGPDRQWAGLLDEVTQALQAWRQARELLVPTV